MEQSRERNSTLGVVAIENGAFVKTSNTVANFTFYTDITQEGLDIILAYRKSLLVYNNPKWEKKTTNNFDVIMGLCDSAKIADLAGICIVDTLGRFLDLINIGILEMTD